MRASEQAREEEATEEQRTKAARLGAVVGASELISPLRLLKIFEEQDEAVDTLVKRGRRIFASAGEEGLQEFGAAVAQNLIEQGIYNEQGTFAGTREPALYGAGVGGFVQALTDMIAPRRGGRRDVTETEDTGSGEGAPVDTQGEQGTRDLLYPRATEIGAAGLDTADTTARLDDVGKGPKDDTLDAKKKGEEKKKEERREGDPKVDEKGRATLGQTYPFVTAEASAILESVDEGAMFSSTGTKLQKVLKRTV